MSPSYEGQGIAVGEHLRGPDGAAFKESTRRAGGLGPRLSVHAGPIEPGDSSGIWRYRVRVTEHNPSDSANQAARPPGIVKLVAKSTAEISQGAGLGPVLSPEEAQARLDAYATPAKRND